MYANGQQVDLFAANDRIRTCTDPEMFPVGGGGGKFVMHVIYNFTLRI